MCLWGAGDETSALAGALTGENPGTEESRSAREESVTLQGTVYRIEEKTKVTAVCVKDNAVSVSGQKFNESKIMVYIRPDQPEIKIGNRIKISGEASVFETARNPGNFMPDRGFTSLCGRKLWRSFLPKQTGYSIFSMKCVPDGGRSSQNIWVSIMGGP